MLHLRSYQLTLLTSLAFGAVLAVFSAPLTAQTTREPIIPDLGDYDSEARQLMELACVSHKVLGPVLYGGYDSETRHGDGYSRFARDSLKKLIEKPAAR